MQMWDNSKRTANVASSEISWVNTYLVYWDACFDREKLCVLRVFYSNPTSLLTILLLSKTFLAEPEDDGKGMTIDIVEFR